MVTPVLPVQGDHVALVLADDSEIAVQIDGVAADGRLNVTVTRVGAQTAPGVDDEFILRWANDRGRHCAWVRLVSFSSVVQWDLELISGIQSLQERQYVRCGSSESASLTRTIVEGVTYHGEVADLSERSVRLRLRVEGFANTVSAAGDPAAENSPDEDLPDEDLPDEGSPDEATPLRVNELVAVDMQLSGGAFSAPGTVLRAGAVHGQRMTVVVLLDVSDRQADMLRQYVFASLRRARQERDRR
ncbi:MAG: hypothetical protein CSA58_02390 [Micrococcales bacterium]|nr:MAG: hypothetical protein CSB46_06495 [Micrococcales bacterium]PIE27789.1 MAG: hypothetical protein CSA58_02390 [Micrococcales bacterium]